MFETLRRAFRLPELRSRILFTLLMFVVIRLGTYIPVPGIDRTAVAALVGKGGFLGMLDLFSGGGIANFAIFSLGVLPYINASIIIELLGSVIPALDELRREGGKEGQRHQIDPREIAQQRGETAAEEGHHACCHHDVA